MTITLVISMFIIFSGSIIVAVLLKRRGEEVIPTAFLSAVFILYFFYCLNILKVGWYLILGVWLFLIVFYIIKLIIKKDLLKVSIKTVITPGVLIFCILCIIFIFISRGKLVGLWDELRLWGAYPKILHYTNTLQIGDKAILFNIMQSYPPGMPLFIYYLTSFTKTFTDWHIFYGYAILGVSLFLPAIKNMKWKNAWFIIPMAAIIIFFPRLFYSFGIDFEYYYNSLFIDATLGLFFGYSFYLALTSCFKTKFDTYSFAMSLFMLVVLKDSGTIFALMSLTTAIVNYILRKGKLKLIKWKLGFVSLLPLAAVLVWKLLMAQNGITNHISYSLESMRLSSLIKIIKQLIIEPMTSLNLYFGTVSLSFIALGFIMALLDTFMIFKAKKEERKTLIITSAILIITNILFIIGYYILVDSAFYGYIPSFHRYMSTILLGDALYLFLRFISYRFSSGTLFKEHNTLPKLKTPVKVFVMTASTLILIAYSAFLISNWAKFDGGWYSKAQYYANDILSAVEDDGYDDTGGPANVYILISGDEVVSAGLHHRIYYDLIGTSANIKNFYDETNITLDEASDKEIDTIVLEWKSTLVNDGFDYVYISDENPLFKEQFGSLFKNSNITPETLYRIEGSGDSIQLVPCD